MAAPKMIKEKHISEEYGLLAATSAFLNRLLKTKHSQLEYYLKQLETNYSDETQKKCETTYEEIKQLEKKRDWEIKRCSEFENKLQKFQEQQSMDFVNKLSKKILGKEK